MTLRDRLEQIKVTRYSEYTPEYATKKRDGYYKKLNNPKTVYTVWHLGDDGTESGYDVPKIVWEYLQEQAPPEDPQPVKRPAAKRHAKRTASPLDVSKEFDDLKQAQAIRAAGADVLASL